MKYAPHTFDQLELETEFEVGPRVVSRGDIDAFTAVSGDKTALHTDADYAATTPLGGLVAHGVLNLAVATGLAYELGIFEGTVLAIRGMDVSYDRPVYPGDSLTLALTVLELDTRPRPDRARAAFAIRLRNQHGKTVLSGTWRVLMRRSFEAS